MLIWHIINEIIIIYVEEKLLEDGLKKDLRSQKQKRSKYREMFVS